MERALLEPEAFALMAPQARAPNLIWRLVEESLSEAAFLWLRLNGALDADDHALSDAERWVEGRLQGALDGVRVAGTTAIDSLLIEALHDQDLGAVGAAAYVLATLDDPHARRALEDAVRHVDAERADALALGLGRACQTARLHALWSRLDAASEQAQAVVLMALAFCGEAPAVASWRGLLDAAAPQLRRAAAAALRFVPSADRDNVISFALDSPDVAVQNNACIAGIAAGDSYAWRRCLTRVEKGEPHSSPLLALTAALGSQREQAHVIKALAVPELQRDALWALGFAGTHAAIEACLAQLRAGEHAPLAAAAFTFITGLALTHARPSSEAVSAPRSDLAAEPSVPHPNVAAVESLWAAHHKRFATDARYINGQVATLASLRKVLEGGPTRRRHGIALELSARSRGAFHLQTRAFCRLQRQQLRQLDALDPRSLQKSVQLIGIQPLAET